MPGGKSPGQRQVPGRLPRPSAAKGLRPLTFPSSSGSTVQIKPSQPAREGGERRQYLVRRRPPVPPGRAALPGSGAGEAAARYRGTRRGRRRLPFPRLRVPPLMKELFVPGQRPPPALAPLPGEPGRGRALHRRPRTFFSLSISPEEAQGAPLSRRECLVFFPPPANN